MQMGGLISNIIGNKYKYYLYSLFKNKSGKSIEKKRTLFYSQFLTKGDLFFDVGANIGNRIKPVLNLEAKVIAIEPDKSCADFLKLKYKNKITIIQKGLADEEKTMNMYVSNIHSSMSSFSEEWINATDQSGRFKGAKWNNKVVVEMTTLDKLIEQQGIPQFIKIDVEGFESTVIRGLSYSIPYISFEYAVPESTLSIIKCIEHLKLINNNLKCNFSIGESMEWGLTEWIDPDEMILFISTQEFINTDSGDIYIKTN